MRQLPSTRCSFTTILFDYRPNSWSIRSKALIPETSIIDLDPRLPIFLSKIIWIITRKFVNPRIIFRLWFSIRSFRGFPEFDNCRHISNFLNHIAPKKLWNPHSKIEYFSWYIAIRFILLINKHKNFNFYLFRQHTNYVIKIIVLNIMEY